MTVGRPAWLLTPDGPVPYDRANEAMHALAERRLTDEIPDTVILLEHPPVFTAGRRAKTEELLWTEAGVVARGGLVRRICLLYTSPSPRDLSTSRMPSSA